MEMFHNMTLSYNLKDSVQAAFWQPVSEDQRINSQVNIKTALLFLGKCN